MKAALLLVCVALAVTVQASKLDHINIDELLGNAGLLKVYVRCIIEDKPKKCPRDALDMRKDIGRLFEEDCASCTEEQKKDIKKGTEHFVNLDWPTWEKFCAKFDPQGKTRHIYEKRYYNPARANHHNVVL